MSPGSRRGAAQWGAPAEPPTAELDVLVPTSGRNAELAVTLAGLAAQDDPPFRVIVGDQSDSGVLGSPAVRAMMRVLRAQGRAVELHRHRERRGMAEHRQFLLDLSRAPRVLYLDDDVWLEPGALEKLVAALDEQRCGFVGYAVQGLSFLEDVRPEETQHFEPWGDGGVQPERMRPGPTMERRWPLHNAANLAHLAADLGLSDGDRIAYRIAWVGGCVLFERRALVAAGGFDFWESLPPRHAGEDRVAQWRVMERFGGAGIVPNPAVHLEAPTTIVDRRHEASNLIYPRSGTDDPDEARRRKETRMSEQPNPIQIQKFLGGVGYPAGRDDLVATARDSGADERVLDALRALPDKQYQKPTEVSDALSDS